MSSSHSKSPEGLFVVSFCTFTCPVSLINNRSHGDPNSKQTSSAILPASLALTNPSLFDRAAADQLFPFLGQLCRERLQRYAELRHHTEQPQAIALARGAGLLEHLNTQSETALYGYADARTPFRVRFPCSPVVWHPALDPSWSCRAEQSGNHE